MGNARNMLGPAWNSSWAEPQVEPIHKQFTNRVSGSEHRIMYEIAMRLSSHGPMVPLQGMELSIADEIDTILNYQENN